MNNVEFIKEEDCCGCSACASICSFEAIIMEPDSKGFLRPKINENRCKDCGMCLQVCNSKTDAKKNTMTAYAVKHKDDAVLKSSSSGGASRAFCESVISRGGVVYGVAYTDEFEVEIRRASLLEECDAFYGSKYVAVNPKDSFKNVYTDLENNKQVLFLSTSCYVAGLLAYLKKKNCDLSNLITVDLICHGTPSPKIFRDYINFINVNQDLMKIDFRSKRLPWKYGTWSCMLTRKNGSEELNTLKSRLFINLFCSSTCLRKYCYSCPYASGKRTADLTISDFWGIERIFPDFYSRLGVSAVQVNSEKGKVFFNQLTNIEKRECAQEDVLQNNLHTPTRENPESEMFWDLYKSKGFIGVARKYGGYNFMGRFRVSKLHDLWTKIRYK